VNGEGNQGLKGKAAVKRGDVPSLAEKMSQRVRKKGRTPDGGESRGWRLQEKESSHRSDRKEKERMRKGKKGLSGGGEGGGLANSFQRKVTKLCHSKK